MSSDSAAAMAIDAGVDGDDVVMASDILDEQLEVWQARHDRHCRGEALIGLSTGLNDLDEKIGGLQHHIPEHVTAHQGLKKRQALHAAVENLAQLT